MEDAAVLAKQAVLPHQAVGVGPHQLLQTGLDPKTHFPGGTSAAQQARGGRRDIPFAVLCREAVRGTRPGTGTAFSGQLSFPVSFPRPRPA